MNELANQRAALERLAATPSLSPESKDALSQVIQHMRELENQQGNPHAAVNALSRAEHALQQVARELERQAAQIDPDALKDMSDDQLTDALKDALNQGNYDAAQQMTQDLNRRFKKMDDDAQRNLGASLRVAMGQVDSDDPSDQTVTDTLNQAADQMMANDDKTASQNLQNAANMLKQLAQQQGNGPQRALNQSLSQLRSARQQQLNIMNGMSPGQARQLAQQQGQGQGRRPGQGLRPGQGQGRRPGQGQGSRPGPRPRPRTGPRPRSRPRSRPRPGFWSRRPLLEPNGRTRRHHRWPRLWRPDGRKLHGPPHPLLRMD